MLKYREKCCLGYVLEVNFFECLVLSNRMGAKIFCSLTIILITNLFHILVILKSLCSIYPDNICVRFILYISLWQSNHFIGPDIQSTIYSTMGRHLCKSITWIYTFSSLVNWFEVVLLLLSYIIVHVSKGLATSAKSFKHSFKT